MKAYRKQWLQAFLVMIMLCMLLTPSVVLATDTTAQTETSVSTEAEEDDGAISAYDNQKTFGISDELDGLSGNAKYVGSKYRQNYHLDLEKTGITEMLESGINMLANVVFGIYQFLATVTCSIVYFCLDFSFAELIAGFITKLQSSLIGGVFKQLWYLSVVAMGFSLVGNMLKREFAEIFKNFAMVVGITILSLLLVSHTETILTASTNITKSASTAIFTGLDTATGMSEGGSYAAVAAGALWSDMIHEPWLTLEFGSLDPDSEVVDEILSLQKGSKDRKEIVKDLNKETGCFDKSRGVDRLSMLLCYSIPFLMKMVVFIAISLLQVVGQVLAVFIMLLAFIVLLLAIIPRYGPGIISTWLEKFLDVHLSMLILSFLMALLIWINKLAYSLAGTIGWFIALVLQAVICVVLFMNYKTILFMLMHPRDGMSDINRMMRRMNGPGGGRRHSGGWEDEEDYPRRRRRGGRYEDDDYEDGYDDEEYEERDADDSGAEPYDDRSDRGYNRGNPSYRRPRPGESRNDRTGQRRGNGAEGYDTQPSETLQEPVVNGADMLADTPDYAAIRNAPTRQELYDMFVNPQNTKKDADNTSTTGSVDGETEELPENDEEHIMFNDNVNPIEKPKEDTEMVEWEGDSDDPPTENEPSISADVQSEQLEYLEPAEETEVNDRIRENNVQKEQPESLQAEPARSREKPLEMESENILQIEDTSNLEETETVDREEPADAKEPEADELDDAVDIPVVDDVENDDVGA